MARAAGLLVLCCLGLSVEGPRAAAQGFLVPQTQAVEYSGKIAAMNPQTRIITIETKTGSVFALTHPTRRTSDRQVIGGIPPVRVRMTAYEPPRELQRGMFIQFRAKVGPRNVVLEPVSDIRTLGRLPANGFALDGGPADGGPADGGAAGGLAPAAGGLEGGEMEQPNPAVDVGPGIIDGPELDVIEGLKERLPPELRDRIGDGPLDRVLPGPGGGGIDGGVGDVGDGVGALAGDDEGDARDGDAGDDDAEAKEDEPVGLTQWMLVSGQVTSPGRRQISVLVPVDGRKQRVRFDLADDAIVQVETDDLSLAAIGDPIRAVGEAVELPRFFATELTVTHVSEDLSESALARLDDQGRLIGAGGDERGPAPADRLGDDRGAADGVPVDPFEIVKREREARENKADADAEDEAAAPGGRPGSVFHGRIIKIN